MNRLIFALGFALFAAPAVADPGGHSPAAYILGGPEGIAFPNGSEAAKWFVGQDCRLCTTFGWTVERKQFPEFP